MNGEFTTSMRPAALISETIDGLLERPVRSLLVALGTVIGTASFLATLGITATIGAQVTSEFDRFRATEIVVSERNPAAGTSGWSLDGVTRLNGVEQAGFRQHHQRLQAQRTYLTAPITIDVSEIDAGATAAIAPRLRAGSSFEPIHHETGARVVLLAQGVARRLGVRAPGEAVRIQGLTYSVLGIFDDVERRPESLLGVLVPSGAGRQLGAPDERDVIIEIAPGASRTLSDQVALALRPQAPDSLEVVAPPDPESFRRGVESDLRDIGILASFLALVIGVVSIASASSAATVQRTGEIGLRRAMGALPRHVFMQLLGESLVLGLLGGIAGTVLGFCVTLATAVINGWSPVIGLRAGAAAAGLGVLAGLTAGLLPAIRGMRISPAAALRD